jgi:hypothetical protein
LLWDGFPGEFVIQAGTLGDPISATEGE